MTIDNGRVGEPTGLGNAEASEPHSGLGPAGAIPRAVLARDLGDGPHRPFGSALHGLHGSNPLATPPLVGRTMKPRAAGACKVCGERKYFCECEVEL